MCCRLFLASVRSRLFISIALLFCGTFIQDLSAQDLGTQTFDDLTLKISKLNSPSNSSTVDTIKSTTSTLKEKWTNAAVSMPKDYKASLMYDTSLLEKASTRPPDKQAAILNFVSTDLTLKNTPVNAMGFSTDFNVKVLVIVTTYSNGAEVSGYMVHYVPAFYEADNLASVLKSFANPTSPSKGTLPPGSYAIWVTKQGSDTPIGKREISVGENGEIEFPPLHFDVP